VAISVRSLFTIKPPSLGYAIDRLLEQLKMLSRILLVPRLLQEFGGLSAKGFGIQDAHSRSSGEGSFTAPGVRSKAISYCRALL
jgi:hypothetical protein